MTDNNNTYDSSVSRRTTLKALSGAAVGLAGIGTAAGDERFADREYDSDITQWVVRLGTPTDVTSESVGVEEIKAQADAAQEPVVQTLSSMQGITVEGQSWLTNGILVDGDYTAEELVEIDGVVDVHPNFEVESPEPREAKKLFAMPEDAPPTYGLEQVSAPDVWEEYDTRGEGATVAVLDTGVDDSHPDIPEHGEDEWAQFDEDGNMMDTDPNDPNGHGTHVSGTVAGGDASGLQIGVAPECDLMNAKVLDDGGTFFQIVAGMEWAVEKGADIINMSLGGGTTDVWIEPVRAAVSAGTIVVSSSGNDGPETSGSPGNVYDSFAIGATDEQKGVAEFSSGERIHTPNVWEEPPADWPTWYTVPNISAPGVGVLSAVPGGWDLFSGTSMAAPHVSGIAALLLSVDSSLGPSGIEQALEGTAVHPDGSANPDTRYGIGITDAFNAVTSGKHDGMISGTVTRSETPQTGVTVETAFGTEDVTDEDGHFHVSHPEGSGTVAADSFGWLATADVDVSGTTEVDLELEPELEASPAEGFPVQPVDMADGDSFDIKLYVAHAEEFTVTLGDDTEDIESEDVTLEAAGETFSPGETLSLDGEAFAELTLTVTVEDVPDEAALALDHEISGLDDSIQLPTGPTTVLTDPEPADFEIVDPNFGATASPFEPLVFNPTIENTGELTDTQEVVMTVQIDPLGTSEFEEELQLGPGEDEELLLQISIPFPDLPRQEGSQSIETDDDSAEGTFDFHNSEAFISDVDFPEAGSAGQPVSVDVHVENVGELPGSLDADYSFEGEEVDSTTAEVGAEDDETVTLSVDTDGLAPGYYDHAVESSDQEFSDTIQLEEPDEHESGVPIDAFDAVLTDGADTTLSTLRERISEWQSPPQGEIDGVEITLSELRALIDWWQANQ